MQSSLYVPICITIHLIILIIYVVLNYTIHKYDFLLANGEKTYLKYRILGFSLSMRKEQNSVAFS